MDGTYSTHGDMKNGTHKFLIGKPEGKRTGRPGRKWKDNIKMYSILKKYGVKV
jgi:hypothetical protein